jgi:hypothetical protein
MIMEAVPAPRSNTRNGHQAVNWTSLHYAGAVAGMSRDVRPDTPEQTATQDANHQLADPMRRSSACNTLASANVSSIPANVEVTAEDKARIAERGFGVPVTIDPSAPIPSGSFQSDLDVRASFFEGFDDAIP